MATMSFMKKTCFFITALFGGLDTMALLKITTLLYENITTPVTPGVIKFKRAYCAVFRLVSLTCAVFFADSAIAQVERAPFLPTQIELNRRFGPNDKLSFANPPKTYHPATWFHFIGGNVSKEGITNDLEAIAKAGFSGIHLFHGQFGGPWPGVAPQITALSPNWDDAVRHAAEECKRLGLTFLMNNTPGWATSGGPWIEPSNAMRHLIWSRTDIAGGKISDQLLPMPGPSTEEWRDYKDITVIAFPTPSGDSGQPLAPASITSNIKRDLKPYFAGQAKEPIKLPQATPGQPYWIEVAFPKDVLLRSVEFPSVQSFNHAQSYEPGVRVSIQGIQSNGKMIDILKNVDMPQSNWQDDQPITLACTETPGIRKYRISIENKYYMELSSLRLFSAARKHNWESEAGWTLRSILREGQHPVQSVAAFIKPGEILDISDKMNRDGKLTWNAPKGKWTVLRFGHVNAGEKNGPAPPEGTGWETNKLAKSGADAHFAGYIGRVSGQRGPLTGGLLNGMLIDSWECHTQSWTPGMEGEFERVSKYSLRKWLPALLGYVVKDHETTARFLTDWRKTLSELYTNHFYGQMAALAHKNKLNVTYETALGDVVPGDILEYFKFADVPMCEFWQPMGKNFVGTLNFKPIKPTASAARVYGKPRVAAESFTSFELTWDEHFGMLREVANINAVQGVSHFVFHTYTHNPQQPFAPPGTSFGTGIGTPFLRGQTWWKYMPDFNNYLSRCTYMLERGKPVSDVLWYLGDEIDHKPDQNAAFPAGYKYDYCNPDVLLNRLKIEDGMLVTPEGIRYRLLWLPDAPRMLPETLEKIYALVQNGATIVGSAPEGLATLSGGEAARNRFVQLVKNIWGDKRTSTRKVGKGTVISGMTLENALSTLKVTPDVIAGDALWSHRKTEGADWYFVSAPADKGFSGELSFRNTGAVELWNPTTGTSEPIASRRAGDRTIVNLDLVKSNACFVVFDHTKAAAAKSNMDEQKIVASIPILQNWTITFPEGWGIPAPVQVNELKPWKDLDLSTEGKAFAGTATYKTTFKIEEPSSRNQYVLDLGNVDMAATVILNGKQVGNLLSPPYRINLADAIKQGENILEVQVTSTWFNRLVFDASQAEE
ncbi:MAG TPA: glycosyl hydrolase, partial [Chitinophagaceae bacterium]|nr:glycosyl hydrolase [Chitinophagaceae bacterium]